MDIRITKGTLSRKMNGTFVLTLDIKTPPDVASLERFLQSEKPRVASLSFERKARSVTANGALWHLIDKIADATKTDRWTVYLEMLRRYGVMIHLLSKPHAVDDVKKQFRIAEEIGKKHVDGVEAIQLRCWVGSSNYDTKQFSRLLDGVIAESRDLGIDFLTDDERDLIMREYEENLP